MRRFTILSAAAFAAILAGGLLSGASVLDARDLGPSPEGISSSAQQGPPDLEELKRRARPVFEIEGVVFTDADERINRLVVGVENRGLARAAEARLAALGIPGDLVEVRVAQPIVFAATLQEKNRPIIGGIEINFVKFPWLYACTLGFNAQRGGFDGFVVNSHCTATQGKVEGTVHYQKYPDIIGRETADPAFFTGGVCPRKLKCRYSDSAFSQRESGVGATLGSIAKTNQPNSGSLTISGQFTITAEGAVIAGETVNKVGRTTGWTQGSVTGTLVDTRVSGTNVMMLDQNLVAADVGGGDSGSPVFQITGGDNVTLVGILWGSMGSSTFVYSPISNIEAELGALTTH